MMVGIVQGLRANNRYYHPLSQYQTSRRECVGRYPLSVLSLGPYRAFRSTLVAAYAMSAPASRSKRRDSQEHTRSERVQLHPEIRNKKRIPGTNCTGIVRGKVQAWVSRVLLFLRRALAAAAADAHADAGGGGGGGGSGGGGEGEEEEEGAVVAPQVLFAAGRAVCEEAVCGAVLGCCARCDAPLRLCHALRF
eukprot:465928-Rhodomonas_salina.1